MLTAIRLLLGKVSIEGWMIFMLVAIVAVMFFHIKVLERIHKADVATIDITKSNLKTALAANEIEEKTIANLKTANTAFKEAAEANTNSMNAAVHRLAGISNEFSKRASSIAAKGTEILADPTCAQLANADIASLCPDLAVLMRDAASRQRDFIGSSGNPSR